MGCTIYIIRPEHKILDLCIEICRIATMSEGEAAAKAIKDAHGVNFNTDLYDWQDQQLVLYFHEIIEISRECKLLPAFCLRELRHAVETLHFKKPEAWQKHHELTEEAISAVRMLSLGLSAPYSCLYSPNDGIVKIDFSRTSTAGNSDDSVTESKAPFPPSPSKTPTLTPTGSPRLTLENPSSPRHAQSVECRETEAKTRNSCPPKLPSPKQESFELFPRVRLRSLDEKETGINVDYGFYHPEECLFDV